MHAQHYHLTGMPTAPAATQATEWARLLRHAHWAQAAFVTVAGRYKPRRVWRSQLSVPARFAAPAARMLTVLYGHADAAVPDAALRARPEWTVRAVLVPTDPDAPALDGRLLDGWASALLTIHYGVGTAVAQLRCCNEDADRRAALALPGWQVQRGGLPLPALARRPWTGLPSLWPIPGVVAPVPDHASAIPASASAPAPLAQDLAQALTDDPTGLLLGLGADGAPIRLASRALTLALAGPADAQASVVAALLRRAIADGRGTVLAIPRALLPAELPAWEARCRWLDVQDVARSVAIPWSAIHPDLLAQAISGPQATLDARPAQLAAVLDALGATALRIPAVLGLLASPGDDLRGVLAAGGVVVVPQDGDAASTTIARLLLAHLASSTPIGRPLLLLALPLVAPPALQAQASQVVCGGRADALLTISPMAAGWRVAGPDGTAVATLQADLLATPAAAAAALVDTIAATLVPELEGAMGGDGMGMGGNGMGVPQAATPLGPWPAANRDADPRAGNGAVPDAGVIAAPHAAADREPDAAAAPAAPAVWATTPLGAWPEPAHTADPGADATAVRAGWADAAAHAEPAAGAAAVVERCPAPDRDAAPESDAPAAPHADAVARARVTRPVPDTPQPDADPVRPGWAPPSPAVPATGSDQEAAPVAARHGDADRATMGTHIPRPIPAAAVRDPSNAPAPHPGPDRAGALPPPPQDADPARVDAALDAALSALLERLLARDPTAVPPIAAAVAAGDYTWADQLVAHWATTAPDAPLPACWQVVLATDAAARTDALARAAQLGPPPDLVALLQAVQRAGDGVGTPDAADLGAHGHAAPHATVAVRRNGAGMPDAAGAAARTDAVGVQATPDPAPVPAPDPAALRAAWVAGTPLAALLAQLGATGMDRAQARAWLQGVLATADPAPHPPQGIAAPTRPDPGVPPAELEPSAAHNGHPSARTDLAPSQNGTPLTDADLWDRWTAGVPTDDLVRALSGGRKSGAQADAARAHLYAVVIPRLVADLDAAELVARLQAGDATARRDPRYAQLLQRLARTPGAPGGALAQSLQQRLLQTTRRTAQ